ncbi:MFS transporter [Rugamonas sp. CCM 8940]|uniref:MFS transporter n=1 Tax=Rugamonas sp. CCM 8940 TaxID=2765359 RepID=UPI0018F32D13|nr:MFS transporter [Rugamonas sp. CCM 8940]MBJ7313637.1 MFS transporter [Rugamonas sp. CCM 8940]
MHQKTPPASAPARRSALPFLPFLPFLPSRPALLEPLRHRRFRQLWLANLAANLGRWVQAFAAAWLVASMSESPLLTTLVQTASYAPMLLFALPAGVLADAVDRPRLLFVINAGMALAAGLMALATMGGQATAFTLLALTFLMGCCAAFLWPAWQASMSTLLEPELVPTAAILNNLSYNLAALLGPWLGGLLFQHIGAAPLFLANALSYLGLLLVYWRWVRDDRAATAAASAAPTASCPDSAAAAPTGAGAGAADAAAAGTIGGAWPAFKYGIASAWQQRAFRALLAQVAAIFFVAIAFAALLPLYVRDVLHLQASTFGSLMGASGAGAVLAAFALPALRARLGPRRLLAAALLVFGLMLAALPLTSAWPLALALVLAGGMAWAAIVSTLNGRAQTAFPSALRARTISIYMLAMGAGQSAGALFWGMVAQRMGVAAALLCAALAMCACIGHVLMQATAPAATTC